MLGPHALAEDLVSGISQDQIQITSNYAGSDIVVFGAVEQSGSSSTGTRDVVVVVRGPDTDFVVRRKARVAGIWLNRDKITLYGMPAYYYVASTRSLAKIAGNAALAQFQLGLAHLMPERESTRSVRKGEPFRRAAIRTRVRQQLYAEAPDGVEFLSYSL
ncbi:MAG: TIGR02186 family protein, partial [Alphaproteobacteria bacterium]|nr:TIGR02186 family protein [Alphaproteobacteria bacterium]